MKNRNTLRFDMTFAPTEEPRKDIYLQDLSVCGQHSFKKAVVSGGSWDRRRLALDCDCGDCGRRWLVTSSLDERVLDQFVTHAGPQAGGVRGPSAA